MLFGGEQCATCYRLNEGTWNNSGELRCDKKGYIAPSHSACPDYGYCSSRGSYGGQCLINEAKEHRHGYYVITAICELLENRDLKRYGTIRPETKNNVKRYKDSIEYIIDIFAPACNDEFKNAIDDYNEFGPIIAENIKFTYLDKIKESDTSAEQFVNNLVFEYVSTFTEMVEAGNYELAAIYYFSRVVPELKFKFMKNEVKLGLK